MQDNNEALDILMEAIEKAGHKEKVKLGTDVAASEFWEADNKKYNLDFKAENAAPESTFQPPQFAAPHSLARELDND